MLCRDEEGGFLIVRILGVSARLGHTAISKSLSELSVITFYCASAAPGPLLL